MLTRQKGVNMPTETSYILPYTTFEREEWASFDTTSNTKLTENEIEELQGINRQISTAEVAQIYRPLTRLLHLYAIATKERRQITTSFLNNRIRKVPFIIGIAGSVAVGKSTTARLLQHLLSTYTEHSSVELVTTDGFLYPNRILEEKGILNRKGFPESYDTGRLIQFLADLKTGKTEVLAPIYSHLEYDVIKNEYQHVTEPDIVIVEGINVLQVQSSKTKLTKSSSQLFVSDFFDFSIYVDAEESNLLEWYIDRFKILRNTAFRNPESYFHRYAHLTDEEAVKFATDVWTNINGKNLRLNILPTRSRANLILEKGTNHSVSRIKLRTI
ncbi:type I pantothenate kinase [Cytobacillus sp. S13-E01]|uniref:type I pantothenate kinase n=1 Tax=Cytobacillus sp. S13-E01 TaxID=3031326 RepID=UPI0023D8A1E1|nr:type I pantothenate kinase [Cytobacillus sp. S13-E01]MDF0728180.1 type I pantothenate kinase [Cytobacillus sp. S13-E01]